MVPLLLASLLPLRPHQCPHRNGIIVAVVLASMPIAAAASAVTPLVVSCLIVRAGRATLLSSSHCASPLSSCAGWLLCCLSPCCHQVLSSCCPLILSLSSHCAAFSLSQCAGWLLHCLLSHHRLVLLWCHTLLLSLSSQCAALSLSRCASWFVHCLLLCRPLVVFSLSCPLVVLRWLVVVLPLIVPPFPSLIACWLVVAVVWPPSNNAAAIKHPCHHRNCNHRNHRRHRRHRRHRIA